MSRANKIEIHSDVHSVGVVFMTSDEEYPGCKLVLSGFGKSIWITLPEIVKPFRYKVPAPSWDAATVQRLGRDWYWKIERRRFGIQLNFGDHLNLHYGRDDINSENPKRISCFLPWKQWEHVRHSGYGLAGEWLIDFAKDFRRSLDERDAVPRASFQFADFDGEVIRADCRIEEREWQKGIKWFRWLRHFVAPQVKRCLEIEFSSEVGSRKGSWKGGMVGHSTELEAGELHEQAFRRYCGEQKLQYIGPAGEAA